MAIESVWQREIRPSICLLITMVIRGDQREELSGGSFPWNRSKCFTVAAGVSKPNEEMDHLVAWLYIMYGLCFFFFHPKVTHCLLKENNYSYFCFVFLFHFIWLLLLSKEKRKDLKVESTVQLFFSRWKILNQRLVEPLEY